MSRCLMTIEDFIDDVNCGAITDYDGSGCYVSDDGIEVRPVDFDVKMLKNSGYHFVTWYNR